MRSTSILLFLAPLLSLASASETVSGVVYEATVTIAENLPDVTFTSYITVTLPHGATAPAGPHVSTITALSTSRWTEYPSATGGAKPTNGTVVASPKVSASPSVVPKDQAGAAGRNRVGAVGAAVVAAVAAVWVL